MKLDCTKTISWEFLVPILQVLKYFKWCCHKGEFLIRKALGKQKKFFMVFQISGNSTYTI